MGGTTAPLAFFLGACILLYNAIHKIMVLAPVVMGGCRLLVYLTAASAGLTGVTGESVWKGLALASYIAGLSWLARKESAPVQMRYWPSAFLAAPIVVGCLFDDGRGKWMAAICSLVLVVWVAWTLLQTFGREHPSVGRVVSHLLAGITLVDMLAVADISHWAVVLFPVWFVLALLLQRFIPAT
jgi:4-hydroxybenzoate polyprenyltransferase